MKTIILLLLLLISLNLTADIFQIDNTRYLTFMSSILILDLANNYMDDKLLKNLNQQQLDDLDSDDIPWFDNWSPLESDQQLKDLSDYTNWIAIGSSVALITDKNLIQNYLVMGEIMLAQSVIGKWVKTISARSRPFAYDDSNSPGLRSNRHSFYSLHASSAFAAARVGYFYYREKGGDGLLIPVLLYSSATASALLRVFAGQHFFSDVAFGALMGTLISDQLIKLNKVKTVSLDLGYNYLGLNYKF